MQWGSPKIFECNLGGGISKNDKTNTLAPDTQFLHTLIA